jgi:hypothetical protein
MLKIVVVLMSIFIVSCNSRNELQNSNSTNQLTELSVEDEIKTSLREEVLLENKNNNLTANDINNVSKLNGFKSIKLDSDISQFNFKNYNKDTHYLSYNFSFASDYYKEWEVSLGKGYITSSYFYFLKDKLKFIEIRQSEKIGSSFSINKQDFEVDYNSHSLFNLFISLFGQPSKVYFYDGSSRFSKYPTDVFDGSDYNNAFNTFVNYITDENNPNLSFIYISTPGIKTICFSWVNNNVIYELSIVGDGWLYHKENKDIALQEFFTSGKQYYQEVNSIIRIYNKDLNLLDNIEKEELKYANLKINENNLSKKDLKGI